MNTINKNTIKGKRFHFLDNLRTVITFLVILLHACGPYIAGDIWAGFWIVEDPANNNISGIVSLILDIFLMATLFFISGYLAPVSLKGKSGWEFLKGKFKRLMAPWIIAVSTLIPLYKVIFLYSRNLPQEHWTTYFHITKPNTQNWLWFLPVLFTFNILYMLISKANIRIPNNSLKGSAIVTFIIGFAYTLSMDLFGLRGWTHTPLLDFQNERILIYFMFFLLGALCFRLKVFDTQPKSKKLYIIINSISWIPINIYIFVVLFPLVFSPGNYIFSKIVDRTIVSLSFHLSLLSIVYTLVETFRRFFNKPGRIWNALNRNSYYVYIIHVIVTGVITLLLRSSAMPSLLKHLTLTVSTFLFSNLIISIFRSLVQAIRFSSSRKVPLQTSDAI